MPSTYSNLKIQLMATGENNTTWGDVTNTNLGTAIEEAIVGSADVVFSNADVTLTLSNTNSTQVARNLRLNLSGTATTGYNLIVPAIEKPYIINNGTNGTITVKNATGTGVAIPAGKTTWVYNNGTDVVEVMNHFNTLSANSMTLTSPLPVASGGTGVNTLTGVVKASGTSAFTASNVDLTTEVTGTLPVANGGTGANTLSANAVLLGNGTSALQTVAPGTSGNVLTSNGSAWISTTPAVRGWTQIATASTNGVNEVIFSSIPATYTTLLVIAYAINLTSAPSADLVFYYNSAGGSLNGFGTGYVTSNPSTPSYGSIQVNGYRLGAGSVLSAVIPFPSGGKVADVYTPVAAFATSNGLPINWLRITNSASDTFASGGSFTLYGM
jgi:hypothetical protein